MKEYMDFNKYDYSLITSEFEYNSMDNSIKALLKGVKIIKTSDEFDAECFEKELDYILQATSEIIDKFGAIRAVIATHEHTVLPAAAIRDKLKIEGLSFDQALGLRDKNIMKQRISNQGLRTPNFIKCTKSASLNEITDFIEKYSKVFVKPINQAGSFNILESDNLEVLGEHINKLLKDQEFLIEESINLPVMHFDGIASNGEIDFISISNKLGNCYDYVRERRPITTIIDNESPMFNKAVSYTKKCLEGLKITDLIFHLEVFFDKNKDDFIFLEIAGRPPGAGISNLIKEVHEVDLFKMSYEKDSLIYKNSGNRLNKKGDSKLIKALMLIPTPERKSLRVTSIKGLDNVPNSVVESHITGPGNIIDFSSINAFQSVMKFKIIGNNMEQINSSVNEIENNVKIEYKEI
jgi:hypothetical protein